MTANSRIPTADEFEAASRHMERISRGTDSVAEEATAWLARSSPIFRVYVIAEREGSIRIFTFFEEEGGLRDFLGTAAESEFEEFVRAGLGVARDIPADEFAVAFEYDSAENVDTNLDGDYYQRMS